MSDSVVSIRIDSILKEKVKITLGDMGLSISDYIRLALMNVEDKQALPFEIKVLNKTTIETLNKSAKGEDVYHCKDINSLFKELEI